MGTEQNRSERSGHANTVEKQQAAKPKQALHNNKRNNQGERGKDYAPTSPKARFNANVEAISRVEYLLCFFYFCYGFATVFNFLKK